MAGNAVEAETAASEAPPGPEPDKAGSTKLPDWGSGKQRPEAGPAQELIDRLGPVSGAALDILSFAGRLANLRRSRATPSTLTTRTLLFALTEAGSVDVKFITTDPGDLARQFRLIVRRTAGDNYLGERQRSFKDLPEEFGPDWFRAQPLDIPSLKMTPNFERVMAQARRIAIEVIEDREVAPEHMMAALLLDRGTRAEQLLEEMGAPPAAIVEALLPRLEVSKSGEKLEAWRALFADTADGAVDNTFETPAVVPVDANGIRRARFSSDRAGPDADDLLDVEREAEAFGRYLADREIDSPLAIALFGDWGSGKTFLMNKIHRHVDLLADKSAASRAAGQDSAYCEDIVQIEFNAWHYMESNLWASLVGHIFDSLDAWLRQSGKKDETIEALFMQLDTAWGIEQKAFAELRTFVAAQVEAQGRLNQARQEYEEAAVKQKTLSVDDFWAAATASVEDYLKDDENEDVAKALEDLENKLGLPELRSSAEDLNRVADETRSALTRGRLVLSSIFTRQKAGQSYVWLVALAVCAPLAAAALISLVPAEIGDHAIIAGLRSGAGEVVAFLTVVMGWVGKAVQTANKALDEFESVDGKLRPLIEAQRKDHQKKLAQAENEVAAYVNRISLAEAQVAEAQKEVARIKQRIREGSARGRLNRFIRERVASGDYSRHLGLISTIRRDFEKLSDIMLEVAKEPDGSVVPRDRIEFKHLESVRQARLPRHLATPPVVDVKDLRAFERVILYIDDLDRCPPDKVVDVLQAIHLLLAFKLFVVVVAVDARWVSRSLKDHYPLLLSENVAADLERIRWNGGANPGSAESGTADGAPNAGLAPPISERSASSHDYLEKIFQVPYWVRPMDEDASRDFIRQLASRDIDQEETGPDGGEPGTAAGSTPGDDGPGGERGDVPDPRSSAEHAEPGGIEDQAPRTAPAGAEPVVEDGGIGVAEAAAGEPEEPGEPGEPGEPEVDDVPANPEQMSLKRTEIDFMALLAPNVGRSPRRSKRFVNVYRLIKAGLTSREHAVFVGRNGQSLDYRVVLVQLAIVTGAPISAPTYFAELVEAADKGGVKSFKTFVGRLERNAVLKRSLEWPNVRGALAILEQVGQDKLVFERLRHWARRVMRYSFTARPV